MKILNRVFLWIIIGVFLIMIFIPWYAAYQYKNKLIMNNKFENEFYAESLCIDGDFEYKGEKIIANNIVIDRKELAYRVGYFNFYGLFSVGKSVDEWLDSYDYYLRYTDGGTYTFSYFWETKDYMNYPISYEEYKLLIKNVLAGYRYETDSYLDENEIATDELFGGLIDCENCTEEQIGIACEYVNQYQGEKLYEESYNIR